MSVSKYLKPGEIIQKLACKLRQRKRLAKLKNTPGKALQLGHIDSLELLETIINDNGLSNSRLVIYDIGGNVGTWTLLAKSLFPQAEIHAFEPLKIHTDEFIKNCRGLNDVHLHQFCLGNQQGSATINISSFSDASSLMEATHLEFEQYNVQKAGEEQVEVKRLADLIETNLVPLADIIKLDIQGYELEALMGMGNWLKTVKYIICEVSFKQYYQNQPQFLDIANYLAGFKFEIFAFSNNTPLGSPLSQIDVLFKLKN